MKRGEGWCSPGVALLGDEVGGDGKGVRRIANGIRGKAIQGRAAQL